jgi:hypothetical protein
MPERATALAIPMEDPEASVRGNAALASLLADGWSIAAAIPAARGERTELLLLLVPPRQPKPVEVLVSRHQLAAIVLATFIGTAVAASLAALAFHG